MSSIQSLTVHTDLQEGKRRKEDFAGLGEKEQDHSRVDLGTFEFIRNELLAGS